MAGAWLSIYNETAEMSNRTQERFRQKKHPFRGASALEAPSRIELENGDFADRCLTAWLWCRELKCRETEKSTGRTRPPVRFLFDHSPDGQRKWDSEPPFRRSLKTVTSTGRAYLTSFGLPPVRFLFDHSQDGQNCLRQPEPNLKPAFHADQWALYPFPFIKSP